MSRANLIAAGSDRNQQMEVERQRQGETREDRKAMQEDRKAMQDMLAPQAVSGAFESFNQHTKNKKDKDSDHEEQKSSLAEPWHE
jgi:hypothetical protein